MPTRTLLSLALLSLPLAACSQATTTAGGQADEAAAIRALDTRIEQAVAARDAATIASFYAADARMYPPHGAPISGTTAILAMWQDFLKTPGLSLTFSPTAVDVSATGDMAHDAGPFRFASDGPDGRITDEGNYSVTWRKTAGEWKIISEMWNSTQPMPEPPKAYAAVPVPSDAGDMEILASSALKWGPLEVPGFKPGIEIAVIHGDPSKETDYTVRLRFPDAYAFPSHWHPNGEHLTVLRGSFMLGMGEKEDKTQLKTYAPGDFIYIPAKMAHFGEVKGVTEIQLHGMGPFQVILATKS
jgi:uncharacterized protein (TIGR02246 family)